MRPLLVFLLLVQAGSLRAQAKYDVALVVQKGGHEVGREEFSISRSGARNGGTLLTSYARSPAVSPTVQIETTLERTPDFGIAKFQLAVQAPEGNIVILAAGSGTRLIVRSVTRGAEAGREMPGGRDIVLLDEGVYSLYGVVAELATPAGVQLTGLFPRSGRRATFTARREPGDDPNAVRTQFAGGIVGTMETDSDGRLVRLELPAAGVVVTRATK